MSSTEKIASIEFTESEANALLNLLDAAVRAQGLSSAFAAYTLASKLEAAFKNANPLPLHDREKRGEDSRPLPESGPPLDS